jgi:hypothetical protein
MHTPYEFIVNSSPLSIMNHEQMRKGGKHPRADPSKVRGAKAGV